MSQEIQPDWDKIAEKFDLFLPQLRPVGDAMMHALKAEKGESILDVATGTGEPALSLARNFGDTISLVCVDAADGMVNAARAKAEKEGLIGVEFKTMPAESLRLADNYFDCVTCRFGVMLFQDPQSGLNEMFRVLKPGGRIVLAVWHLPDSMTTMKWAYSVFEGRIPEDRYPPLKIATSLGGDGILSSMLESAGFGQVQTEIMTFHYEFNSFDDYWQLTLDSGILDNQLQLLKSGEVEEVRGELAELAKDFEKDGVFRVPHNFVLASARKSS